MSVLDASALVELLLWSERGQRTAALIGETGSILHAPHLVTVEVLHVLRRLVAQDELSADRATGVVADLMDLDIDYHDHLLLTERIWQLRGHLTSYDATYVALSELLDQPLITFDERLAQTTGHLSLVVIP